MNDLGRKTAEYYPITDAERSAANMRQVQLGLDPAKHEQTIDRSVDREVARKFSDTHNKDPRDRETNQAQGKLPLLLYRDDRHPPIDWSKAEMGPIPDLEEDPNTKSSSEPNNNMNQGPYASENGFARYNIDLRSI